MICLIQRVKIKEKDLAISRKILEERVLPKWAKKDTLTIFVSYSGNTEETLSSFKVANQKKCKILCISSGGKLQEMCELRGVTHIKIPSGFQPRAATMFVLFPLIVFLKRLDLMKNDIQPDIEETIAVAQDFVKNNSKSVSKESNFSKQLAEKIYGLSAVVVIHTFGRPADIDRIKEVVGDVPVIEDCAHSLLSRCGEEQTGTLSFASFFSFKKYLSMGAGGMIILNNDEFIDGFQREIDSLDSFTTINEIKDAFVTYGHSFLYHKPWFGLFSYPIGSYMRNIVGQNDGEKNFKANKIRKTHLNLLFKKLNRFGDRVELQRKNSFILLKGLRDTSLILPYEKKNTYCNYYLFPMRFNNKKERDEAHVRLGDLCIDTAKLYSETPMKARRFYGYKGDCPNSEIVADTILIIPNYYTLAEKNLIKIIDSIRKERLL